VSCFLVGQLFNRFRFHSQQAYFFAGGEDDRLAQEFSVRLALRSRTLFEAASREAHAITVEEYCRRITTQFDGDPDFSAIANKRSELEALPEPQWAEVDMRWVRQEMLYSLFQVLGELRDAVRTNVEPEDALTFSLGETIDQGLYPPDVYLDLDELPAPKSASATPAIPEPRPTFGDSAQLRERRRVRLATRTCGAGDVPPRQWWWLTVQQRWQEVLPNTPVPDPRRRTVRGRLPSAVATLSAHWLVRLSKVCSCSTAPGCPPSL
jgi:hypothetical protein